MAPKSVAHINDTFGTSLHRGEGAAPTRGYQQRSTLRPLRLRDFALGFRDRLRHVVYVRAATLQILWRALLRAVNRY